MSRLVRPISAIPVREAWRGYQVSGLRLINLQVTNRAIFLSSEKKDEGPLPSDGVPVEFAKGSTGVHKVVIDGQSPVLGGTPPPPKSSLAHTHTLEIDLGRAPTIRCRTIPGVGGDEKRPKEEPFIFPSLKELEDPNDPPPIYPYRSNFVVYKGVLIEQPSGNKLGVVKREDGEEFPVSIAGLYGTDSNPIIQSTPVFFILRDDTPLAQADLLTVNRGKLDLNFRNKLGHDIFFVFV